MGTVFFSTNEIKLYILVYYLIYSLEHMLKDIFQVKRKPQHIFKWL